MYLKKLSIAIAVCAAALAWCTPKALAGALFTTDANCQKVNGNIYDAKTDVYLNGGPDGQGSALEKSTEYCIRVESPGGAVLSTQECRKTTDASGHFACFNLYDCTLFIDTDNPGGEYKVVACPVDADGNCFFRPDNQCKSDNFKVRANITCTTPTLICPFDFTAGCGPIEYAAPVLCPPQEATIECIPYSGTTFVVGDKLVNCTAKVGNDLIASCSFTVHVIDDGDCGTGPEECILECPGGVNLCNPTTIPDCDITTVKVTGDITLAGVTCTIKSESTAGCVTTRILHYSATSTAGVECTCDQTITWTVDTTEPTIACPTDVTVECGTDTSPDKTGWATACDNCNTSSCDVRVNVYSGFTLLGGGTPYAGPAGSLTSSGVTFATDTGYAWSPFGLGEFGADITGCLSVAADGTYSFSLNSDDGSRLLIDGGLVVDNGDDHGPTLVSGSTSLTAGTHSFEVQFFECCGFPSGVDLSLPAGVTYGGCVPVTYTDSDATPADNDCKVTKIKNVIKRTWTATDDCKNTASCDQLITVKDTTPPTFDNCTPGNTDLGCNPTSIPDCDPGVTASDTCGTATVTCVKTYEGTISSCVHKRTLTYTATDACGNTATCVRTFTWTTDTTPPTFNNCTSGTTDLGCNPTSIPGCDPTVTASDNCGPATVTCNSVDSGTPCARVRTLTYTATDGCGKTATCVRKYTWKEDTTAPVLYLPGPITVTAASCSTCANVPFTASANDNCDGTVTLTCDHQSGDKFCVGTTTVYCSATDKCGKKATGSFKVTVNEVAVGGCGGALTIGFWQNKNGQAIVKCGGASLLTYLQTYNPFKDATAPVDLYVYNVIKAANASGSSMNAMLKAQMLATALNVYFTDPTKGAACAKFNAKSLGCIKIDLTQIGKIIDNLSTGTGTSSGKYDASAAFNASAALSKYGCVISSSCNLGTCVSVADLLNCAASSAAPASAANPLASPWYCQNKALQELAKNTFDSINNGVALVCGTCP